MPDVNDSPIYTVEPEVEGDIQRKFILTVELDPATNSYTLGVRDVTADEDFSEPDFTADDSAEDTPPVSFPSATE